MPVPPYRAIAERRVCDRLLYANAVWPGNGQALDGLPWMQQRALQRLIACGAIREEHPGRFYLDAPAYAAHMARRRRRVMIAMIVVVIAMMVTVTGALTGMWGIVSR